MSKPIQKPQYYKNEIEEIAKQCFGKELIENRNNGYSKLLYYVLNDRLFTDASGSSKSKHAHHYGEGGLLRHTYEVIATSMEMAEFYFFSDIEKEILFFAALYHDYGKIFDYEEIDGEFVKTDHAKKIHHITASAIRWNIWAGDLVNPEVQYEVTHAILAHHQLQEWGSPISPQSRPAWVLHNCDSISARLD